jgi:biopolymer transport protein ExbB
MRFKLLHLLFSSRRSLAALMCSVVALVCLPVLAQAPNTAVAAQVSPLAPAAVASLKKPAETLDNPYGIEALWKGSDWVARSVLVLLAIMSIGSWYIIVTKLLEQSRIGQQAGTISKAFWAASSVTQGAGALELGSPYRFIAESGAQAAANHTGLKAHIPANEWVSMSIQAAVDRVQAKAQGGLAFLATVGSTSPFVGLFGTVWGIYHALTAIGISGQASIDKVAGPVGEALIMTAIGLAVAIPAVLGYNWLARRNKVVMDEVREFSEELNAVLVGSGGKAA